MVQKKVKAKKCIHCKKPVKKKCNLFCFIKWTFKLLLPNFLVGEPNLFDNIQVLMTEKRFRPIRTAFMIWTLFVCVVLGYGYYWLDYIVPETTGINIMYTNQQKASIFSGSADYTLFDVLYHEYFSLFIAMVFVGLSGILMVIYLLFSMWLQKGDDEDELKHK